MKEAILITGGAGFIGSHLCEYFYKEGFEVVCVDNLLTGRKDNISNLSGQPGFSFVEQDISKGIDIKINNLKAVLNFASPASPKDYIKYPIETLRVGAFGTYAALELARANKARFLMASTSEVYGDPLKHPQDESYWGNVNPIGQRSMTKPSALPRQLPWLITGNAKRTLGLDGYQPSPKAIELVAIGIANTLLRDREQSRPAGCGTKSQTKEDN